MKPPDWMELGKVYQEEGVLYQKVVVNTKHPGFWVFLIYEFMKKIASLLLNAIRRRGE